MQTYRVNTISKFFEVLENNKISDFIYRGQNEPYFSIKASGYRPYMGGWTSDMIYDMQHIHSAFYDRIIGQITPDEKRYFLAYCQHHGIPTNLVDVTYSPLVALFFACEGKHELTFTMSEFIGDKSIDELEKDIRCQEMFIQKIINKKRKPFHSDYAQVYMVNKDRLIDITDFIIELNGKNLFEEILVNDALVLKLLDIIQEHFKSIDPMILDEWLKNIINTYIKISEIDSMTLYSGPIYKLLKSVSEGQEYSNNDIIEVLEKSRFKSNLHKQIFKNISSMNTKKNNDITASLYTAIMIEMLNTLKCFPRKVNIDMDIYFTYKPPQLFNRISNQHSFFIYQPALYTNDGVYDYCELNIQSINPDIIIEVDDYSTVLKNLNLLGIDNGSVYGDIDNIAKSVLSSSGKMLKV